jgi:hypothetical protein
VKKITRRGVLWAAGALLGIAVTAALTWSVSQLSSQRIGLSSQPLSVIRGLAPPPNDDRAAGALRSRTEPAEARAPTRPSAATTSPRPTLPVTPAPAVTPSTSAPAAAASGTSRAAAPVGQQSEDGGQGGQGASTSGRDD